MVHGLMSGPQVWEPLRGLIAADRTLGFVETLSFEYATGLFSVNPLQVFPSIDTVADSLKEYLVTEAGAFDQLLLVTHSQGGLVAQRYLARMLQDGRGGELVRIQRLVMLACPSNGSELLLSLRRRVLGGRHPQEADLRPLNDQVNTTLRTVVRDVVHASAVTDRTCPIPVSVYAGESDGVVSRTSAQSVFPDSSALPGDHFSILKADSPRHRTFTALRRLILATRSEPYVPAPEAGPGPVPPSMVAPAAAGRRDVTGRPGKGRHRVVVAASVAALAVVASVLHFAPMPWGSDADAKAPGPARTSSKASSPVRADPKVPAWHTNGERYFVFDIGVEPAAEYFRVRASQKFDFLWNISFNEEGLLEDKGRGSSSYRPEAGATGAALRFGTIDDDDLPDCIVVDTDGGMTIRTWLAVGPDGSRMCMEKPVAVADVSPEGHLDDVEDLKEIQFADIDGDVLADYLRIEPDGRVTVWYNRTTGRHGQADVKWSAPAEIGKPVEREGDIRFANINDDQFIDKVLITSQGGVLVWEGRGVGVFAEKERTVMADTGIAPERILIADVEGTGDAEFLQVDKSGQVHRLSSQP
ncbi:esterase/lipase family protein [Streptomyces sp. NPDC017520]|uniref:esterase/lipase family protein n=1 Tax=Streptomyces sp. NPDC017520 TaxID=3364998 RepID=UPI00378F3055